VSLSPTQIAKLQAKIAEVWKNGNCEVCGTTLWNVLDRLYELREYHQVGQILGGPLIPLAVCQCRNCGHVRFMNAIQLGIVDATTGKVVDG